MSNFIFPRRLLQQSINRLDRVLSRTQLNSLLDRLNKPGKGKLPAMWELIVLDVLAQVGSLRHEVRLPTGRCPDIELVVSSAEKKPLTVVGDVMCVSDAGLDENNPIETLRLEMYRLALKAGLNPDHFRYDVRGDRVGTYGKARMKLLLPSKSALLDMMSRDVYQWMTRLKSKPGESDNHEFDESDVKFCLSYDPKQRYSGGGHLSYTVAASLTKNPLFTALKSKAKQLKGAAESAIRLIIVCDSGSDLLASSNSGGSFANFSAIEVAEDFIRQNTSIDAVLLLSVQECHDQFHRLTLELSSELVFPPLNSQSPRMGALVVEDISELLKGAVSRIPAPKKTAKNAALRCKEEGFGPDMIGGYEMGDDYVKLSSRALQRLLAEEISVREFIAKHNWGVSHGPSNPFSRMASAGRMIEHVGVEYSEAEDDDWLSFKFGPQDPAVSEFQVSTAGPESVVDDD